MTLETWVYYLIAVLILTASPGPSSLLCLSKGVTNGIKQSFFTAVGSLTAITGILTLSFAGLGVLITSSELAFNSIKWTGAAYLIYLGINALLSKQEKFESHQNASTTQTGCISHFLSGFIVGASNPKAILFFSALFPQFIDSSAPLMLQYIIFASTFIVLELSWLLIYGYLGTKSSNWIFKNGRAKLFNRLTGGVFITAGTFLSVTNRS
ncbi:LysE family translocator [Endozoicomonas sp. 8E]|uniref:LysE family translocator n=1 Tax=Endozoicomonas sp. 8E TaxID=3035692 RepID=UPI002938DC68|nr:LysE family translocator [Endozoicomonas sp. 8E]WOG25923.1 LysE family translocator [Endozoicomonas sp. 8E]